jgi:gluconolactonase
MKNKSFFLIFLFVMIGEFLLLIEGCKKDTELQAQDSHTNIVPVGASVNKLSSNQFVFTEGPVWYNDSVLLFVDDGLGSPDIFQYNPVGKQFRKWPGNSAHCTGLSCDKDGYLIGASWNILMINNAGQLIKTLASGYNGKSFNNPNDLIADNKGGVYFSDPDFFLTSPPQDKTAVYYIDSTGNVKRVIELAKPNGLVLSPDGSKLYVVETENKYVYSLDVAFDGSVSGKLNLAELQRGGAPYADGMAVDIYGNIYVASDKGIQVFSPQGAAITTIVVPETPSNCDFGGSDFKTLYITAGANLYSIDLNYPGYAVSRKI